MLYDNRKHCLTITTSYIDTIPCRQWAPNLDFRQLILKITIIILSFLVFSGKGIGYMLYKPKTTLSTKVEFSLNHFTTPTTQHTEKIRGQLSRMFFLPIDLMHSLSALSSNRPCVIQNEYYYSNDLAIVLSYNGTTNS